MAVTLEQFWKNAHGDYMLPVRDQYLALSSQGYTCYEIGSELKPILEHKEYRSLLLLYPSLILGAASQRAIDIYTGIEALRENDEAYEAYREARKIRAAHTVQRGSYSDDSEAVEEYAYKLIMRFNVEVMAAFGHAIQRNKDFGFPIDFKAVATSVAHVEYMQI